MKADIIKIDNKLQLLFSLERERRTTTKIQRLLVEIGTNKVKT